MSCLLVIFRSMNAFGFIQTGRFQKSLSFYRVGILLQGDRDRLFFIAIGSGEYGVLSGFGYFQGSGLKISDVDNAKMIHISAVV